MPRTFRGRRGLFVDADDLSWTPRTFRGQETRAGAPAPGDADLPREPIPIAAPARQDCLPRKAPSFHPFLAEKVTRKDPPEKRKAAALSTIAALPRPDVTVYTDGSVLAPDTCEHGGGGFYLVDAAGTVHRGRCAAGRFCTSYRAEMQALLLALQSIAAEGSTISVPPGGEIQLLTDSQSAIRRLERGPWQQTSRLGHQVWLALRAVEVRHDAHVTLAYVPGHVDLDGNEQADQEAKGAAQEARARPEDPTPIPLDLAKTILRGKARRDQWAAVERDSAWWAATQGKAPRYPGTFRRGQERVIAQLRAGKCPITAQYQHRIEQCDSPACECGAAVEDVEHLVLRCPITELQR
eukprot:gene58039-biopygen21819